MNISVILAHPDQKSFNHAIAQTARRALDAKAALDANLARYSDELQRSDGLVIVHPNWWGQPPAAMKGWIDRVFRPGVAYRFQEGDSGEGVPVGLLRAETAIVFNTTNTPPEREMEVFGDPLDRLWKKCILEFCGVKEVVRESFSVVVTSTPAQRAEWLERVEQIVAASFRQATDCHDE
jgi:putative NADPH-quinone reductase